MSGVTKRKKLRVNSPVRFDLNGSRVIGTLVKLEDNRVFVRFASYRILILMQFQVLMMETEFVEDSEGGILIGERPDEHYLVWEWCDDDRLPSYFGTKVDCWYYCWVDVDPAEILNER